MSRQSQNFQIGKLAKARSRSGSKINSGFPAKNSLDDILVEIGVRLKPDFHGCGVCSCGLASSSFL